MNPNDPDKRHPELRVHVDILLRWINPLIQLANKRPLTNDDVWPCPPNEQVETQSAAFWKGWELECERAYEQGRKPSFLWALVLAYGDRLILTGIFQLIFLLLQLLQPFLVGELVRYIQTGNGGIETGVGLALGFGAVAFISSLVLSQVFYLLRRLGDVLRAGVMMAVYEQTLRLTTAARLQNTIGQTTNLIAIDAEKLNLAVQFIHFLWHGPCISLAIMIILITEIGYQGALVGLAFLFLLVPLQNHVAASIGVARRLMIRFTDERVKLINELLQAIRVIKLYAWEGPIEERVREVRASETALLHTYLNRSGTLRELLFAAQPVAAILMFTTASYGASRPLTVVQVFRMLAFLGITRFPLNLLAQALKSANDAMVSIQRLENFFLLPVLPSNERTQVDSPEIVLDKATFTWQDLQASLPTSSRRRGHSKSSTKHEAVPVEDIEGNEADVWLSKSFSLRSLTFRTTRPNELVAVIGAVGSGKSSFISALLNEMNLYAGKVHVAGTVSYCAQTPWIQNLTLKQNVLFSVPAETVTEAQQRDYLQAIHAAALTADISILAHGDDTEIGERGINLSGGQKARVSLARAFFSRYRSQIYLLDDPFSAVDGNTGNHIFQHGILTLLHDKLRVIALNSHMHLLKHFDRVLVLQDGRIVLDGSVDRLFDQHEEMMTRITGLARVAVAAASPLEGVGGGEERDAGREPPLAAIPPPPLKLQPPAGEASPLPPTAPTLSSPSSPAAPRTNATLIKAELTQTQTTLWGAYVQYVSASLLSLPRIVSAPFYHASSGPSPSEQDSLYTPWVYALGLLAIFTMVLVFSSVQLFRVGVDVLLAKLAEHWHDGVSTRHLYERWYYICFGLLIATMVVRAYYLNFFAVRSSRVLHSQILRKVLAAPVPAFFDTHTLGAILNRFAKDMEVVDANIPEFMLQLVMNWFQVFSVFGLCIWASPWFAIILLPMAGLFRNIYVYFSAASRDLKKLESVSRSPIYASLSETLAGLETIRAYSDTPRFLTKHLQRMDLNKKLLFHLWICMSWMTVRLEMSTASVLFTVAIICVCLRDRVSPIALGIALSFGLQLTALFQRCVQLVIEMVTYMTSTERVLDYMALPQEKDTLGGEGGAGGEPDGKVAQDWPREGSIVLEDVWMSYRDNPAVLRGITVHIASGQRIGVCGRTGAGKSSVMMALFRIVELSRGRILIDGRDISTVPLRTLRSALAIIPQDPVLFTGSIRFQLDPFEQHSDDDVWTALEQVRMADMVRALPQGLQDVVKENGENLSQGQRQLLCIARALLRKAKILVVDEGTSAVDPYTDELIQHVLREEVEQHGATVLAIAHRLQTIADFDKILVLGAGQVLEFGRPTDLLADPASVFSSMMAESAH